MSLEDLHKNRAVKTVVLLLVFLFALQIYNKSSNLHTHKFTNGQIVIHAHPYDKSNDSKPYKSHHHSLFEIVLLESLDLLVPMVSLLLILIIGTFKLKYFLTSFKICVSDLKLKHKSRAPPVSFYYSRISV